MKQWLLVCATLPMCGGLTAQDLASQDLAYGLVIHNQIAAQSTILPEGEVAPVLRSVFTNLSNTPIVREQGATQVLFYMHGSPNAFAGAGGRLYVTDSLVGVVDANPGILAFALGHELAHNILRHGIQKYLHAVERARMIEFYRIRAAQGDKGANWALVGYVAADKIASAKMERDQENAADRLGLLIAAQAGYHPDFGIAAARLLRQKLGEQSKFGAFFSDHPRWTTREERAEQNRPEALAEFNGRWPSAGDSPGGPAPTLFFVNQPTVTHTGKSYHVNASFTVRNARAGGVSAYLLAMDDHAAGSTIAFRKGITEETGSLSAELPESFFKKTSGHQWVKLAVQPPDQAAVESVATKIK